MSTPNVSDFFKSFYYKNTYLPPVDLSEKELKKYLLENENKEISDKVSELISVPEVQKVLSETLTYDPTEIEKRNKILIQHKFKLLSEKPIIGIITRNIPFYSVIEHPDLPGWVIKSGANRIQKDQVVLGPLNDQNEMAFFTESESILRIKMVERISKIALESKIDVVLPKKKLVAYKNSDGITEINKKYCVVCEKLDVLSKEETVKALKNMKEEKQKEIARKISTLIQKVGLVDTSFDNIRLNKEGKLCFLDTEPTGLMVVEKMRDKSKDASVEKCARIGLFTLMSQVSSPVASLRLVTRIAEPGFEAFFKEIENDYAKAIKPKLSTWKITASVVSIGLIPLIQVIVALIKMKLTKQIVEKLKKVDPSQQKDRTTLAKKLFVYIEGVPFH